MLLMVALANGLVAAIFGLRFRVKILIPLIAVAIVEALILKHDGTWWSALWSVVVLIVSLEIGYLIGSAVDTVWLESLPGNFLRHFTKPKETDRSFISQLFRFQGQTRLTRR